LKSQLLVLDNRKFKGYALPYMYIVTIKNGASINKLKNITIRFCGFNDLVSV